MEGRRGARIQAPEQRHLTSVHEPRLPPIAVVVPHQMEARVTGEEIELFGERVAEGLGLAARRLDREDRLPEDGSRALEGEGEDVGPPPHAPEAGVEPPDLPVVHQGQGELVVPDPEGVERDPQGPAKPALVHGKTLAVLEGDHGRGRPVARPHSS